MSPTRNEEEIIDEIIREVAEAVPHISSGLLHRREYVGEENPSDDKQLEADVWANEILKELITSIEGVGEFASEEEETITDCGTGLSVAIDPLDGSSNIPTNNLVGTIVGVYDEELPCKGENLVASFYVVFGPLKTMVIARKGRVNEYVIEEKPGDQVEMNLSGENLTIPEPYTYGFGGNKNWENNFREFEQEISRKLKLRYGGALVGDVNQALHHGGIFGYPSRTDAPDGKLRLIFECNPIAHIFETAGGASTNGEIPIRQIEPQDIHEKVPFFVGHNKIISKVEENL